MFFLKAARALPKESVKWNEMNAMVVVEEG
jgi:hypothetical protein